MGGTNKESRHCAGELLYPDLGWGHTCNIKCGMCSPHELMIRINSWAAAVLMPTIWEKQGRQTDQLQWQGQN